MNQKTTTPVPILNIYKSLNILKSLLECMKNYINNNNLSVADDIHQNIINIDFLLMNLLEKIKILNILPIYNNTSLQYFDSFNKNTISSSLQLMNHHIESISQNYTRSNFLYLKDNFKSTFFSLNTEYRSLHDSINRSI